MAKTPRIKKPVPTQPDGKPRVLTTAEKKQALERASKRNSEEAMGRTYALLRDIISVPRSAGQPRDYTPSEIIEEIGLYIDWCHEHPMAEHKTQFDSKEGKWQDVSVPKMRAGTIQGFQLWLGITRFGWRDYKNNEKYSHCVGIVEGVLYVQPFEGAAAGLLSPQMISKQLGLTDKVEAELSGDLTVNHEVNDRDLAKFIALTLTKAAESSGSQEK
jgi:hypothetical protein